MITTHWDAVKRFVSTVRASKLTELAVVGCDEFVYFLQPSGGGLVIFT